MKRLVAIISALLIAASASAQHFSVSTNFLEWANMGTINAEVGFAAGRHVSISAGGRFNNWSFPIPDNKLYGNEHKQTTGYVGVRYWPWYVFSGWWVGAKAQYQQARGNVVWSLPSKEVTKGVGGGLSFGYTIMLNKHLNLDLGVGGWAGKYFDYKRYDNTTLIDSQPRGFIKLDEVIVALSYVF